MSWKLQLDTTFALHLARQAQNCNKGDEEFEEVEALGNQDHDRIYYLEDKVILFSKFLTSSAGMAGSKCDFLIWCKRSDAPAL